MRSPERLYPSRVSELWACVRLDKFAIWSSLFGHSNMLAEVLRGTSRRKLLDR